MLNDRLLTLLPLPIQQVIHHPKADAGADLVLKLAALLAGLLLVAGFLALPGLSIFGHDEVHYYRDFSLKLAEDGRWLNYLLHDFLRSVPLPLWSLLFLSLSWLLYYRLALGGGFDATMATLVASTTLLAASSVEMSIWPATPIPALVIMLLASLLRERGLAYPLIYLGSGLLLFGAMQTYYFLLPLLFLGQFLAPTLSPRTRWHLLFKHLCWWVLGAIAGVLLMSLLLWPLAGHFGPRPAGWRDTHVVQDWPSLVNNLSYVSSAFLRLLEQLLRQGGVTWGFILTVAVIALLRARALLAQSQALALLGAVIIAFFVFSLPMAPLIHLRSLVAMAAAVVLVLALVPGHSRFGRVIAALLLLKLSYFFSLNAQDFFAQHEGDTAWHKEKLQQLIPGDPRSYAYIALQGTMDPAHREAFIFNDPSRMHPILVSLGTREYLDCRIEARCNPVGTGPVLAVLPYAKGQVEFSVDAANIGIIRYRE